MKSGRNQRDGVDLVHLANSEWRRANSRKEHQRQVHKRQGERAQEPQGEIKINEKCSSCSESVRCKDTHKSWMFFAIGIIATIALRMVTVLININPLYGKISWYVGVGGFFIFFV